EIYADKKIREQVSLNYQRENREHFEVSSPYPNPFAHEARFDITGDAGVLKRVEVYDVSGKPVYAQKVDQEVVEYSLDGNALPAGGFYIIRFVFDEDVINKKLYYTP